MAYQGGNLKGISANGVKMYSVSGNRSVATWLAPKKLRALRKDNDYQKRVELVQDLRFEIATSKIKATSDGEYLIASGIYPPQVKVYELRELSLKFERHLISEIVDFEILSDDYSKLAFLCADRSVNLHAKYGSHYSLRIPRMGRDLAYDSWSCDLLCAASSPDLYRINLEQGRFLSSVSTQSPALNVVTRSKLHGLVAIGCEDGAVECFDMRVRSSVGRIDVVDEEITAIQLNGSCGYQMAVGSSAGKVFLYDLRASRPIRTKDHMFGSPIVDIKWHQTLNYEHPKLITADKHIVRIWDPDTGEDMTSIEPTAGRINDVCAFNESGLLLLGLDCSQIPSYFIPTLGPAPKWCSYLENLTEELEETAEATIYDNFKFVTKEELEQLNSTNLIGTDYLRAYMHGYFMDYRLYKKAKDIATPFNREAYLEQKKREKIEALCSSRITIKRKLPKVNKAFFARLHENDESVEEKKDVDDTTDVKKSSKKRKGLNSDMIKDERFASIFENKDFEIDEQSQEYMALHPLGSTNQKPSSSSLVEEHFEPIMEEDEDQTSSDDNVDNGDGPKKKSRHPRLYEVKDERHAEAFYHRVSLSKEDALPMEERVAALNRGKNGNHNADEVKIGAGGSREISFVSRSSARYKEDDDDDMDGRHEKRRMKSLGLKSEKLPYGGGGGRGHRGGRGRGRGGGGGGRGFGGGGGRGGRGGRSRGRGRR